MRNGIVITLSLALVVVMAGCTGTTVRPGAKMDTAGSKIYTVAVVGEMTAKDTLWQAYGIEMGRALTTELTTKAAFPVNTTGVVSSDANTAKLVGQITEVDKGSVAARLLVGFGAGRSHITAEFQVLDGITGDTLTTYSVTKTYAGGAGIGGAGLLDMDDMAAKLGVEAADHFAEWARTGKVAAR